MHANNVQIGAQELWQETREQKGCQRGSVKIYLNVGQPASPGNATCENMLQWDAGAENCTCNGKTNEVHRDGNMSDTAFCDPSVHKVQTSAGWRIPLAHIDVSAPDMQ